MLTEEAREILKKVGCPLIGKPLFEAGLDRITCSELEDTLRSVCEGPSCGSICSGKQEEINRLLNERKEEMKETMYVVQGRIVSAHGQRRIVGDVIKHPDYERGARITSSPVVEERVVTSQVTIAKTESGSTYQVNTW